MAKTRTGTRFGKWMVDQDEPLGHGGNARVWSVTAGAERGALKVIHSSHIAESGKNAAKAQRVQRFLREVRFYQDHSGRAGVLPMLDSYLPEALGDDDRPWVVTARAQSLETFRKENPTTPLRTIVEWVAAVAETLAQLHADGIYHRDIKPDNLFVLDGSVYVGDFGLIKVLTDNLTLDGDFVGPAHYIAPELMEANADTPAGPADVYSLAKTFWVLASRQNYPIPGEQRMLASRATSISGYHVNHPRVELLDSVLDRCTRHDPSERLTMTELRDELRQWSKGVSMSDSPPPPDLRQTIDEIVKLSQPQAQRNEDYWKWKNRYPRALLKSTFATAGCIGEQCRGLDVRSAGIQDSSDAWNVQIVSPAGIAVVASISFDETKYQAVSPVKFSARWHVEAGEVFWEEHVIVNADLPSAEQAITNLAAKLEQELPLALQRLTGAIKLRSSQG